MRNPSVWTMQGQDIDLTGISPWNSFEGNKRAGTLITPRHIAFASHFPIPNGTTINFVTNDNQVVSRTLESSMGVQGSDIAIGRLNADVPSSITHYPIIPVSEISNRLSVSSNIPALVLDQEEKALVRDLIYEFPSSFSAISNTTPPPSSHRNSFSEQLIGGDSGNPLFIIIDGKPVLVSTHTSPNGGPNYLFWLNSINTVLNSLGGGYQVSTFDLSCFNRKPIINSASSSASVIERPEVSTVVGGISSTDPDGDSVNYEIVSGNNNGAFAINPAGQVFVASSTAVDFNLNRSFELFIRATDDADVGLSTTTSLVINVQNVTDAPYFTHRHYSRDEGTSGEVFIGQIDYVTEDLGNLNFTLLNNNNIFYVSTTTGNIYLKSGVTLDYESQSQYRLDIRIADGIGSFESFVNIDVNNKNDTHTITSENFSVNHMAPLGTLVGNIVVSDQDDKSFFVYNIISGNINNAFALDPSIGSITVNNPSAINHSSLSNIRLIISTKDNGFPDGTVNTVNKIITININPPAPTNTQTVSQSYSGGGGGSSGNSNIISTVAISTSLQNNSNLTSTSTSSFSVTNNNSSVNLLANRQFSFARNLQLNSRGEDVRQLQIFLNNNGFLVSNIGPGSRGRETNLFGPATRSALIRFQRANNLSPSIGIFGPMTRSAITNIKRNSI